MKTHFSKKSIQISAILFSLILISNVFAVRFLSQEMEGITSPVLSNKLIEVLDSFKKEQYENACNLIDIALQNTNAQEFAAETTEGPLDLQLKTEKAYFKTMPYPIRFDNPESLQVAVAAFEEYESIAAGKKWTAYSLLCNRIIDYYTHKKEYEKARVYMEKMLIGNPFDIVLYLNWGLKVNLPASVAVQKMDDFVNERGIGEKEAAFIKVQYKERDGENVFQNSLDYLKKYPKAEPDVLNKALTFLRKSLDVSDINQCREYYTILSYLALNQPSDEKHLPLVSKILNEKKKLETIIPEVKY